MKRMLMLTLLPLLLWACGSNESTTRENHEHHDHGSVALKLNNGKKWNADDATMENVAVMHNIIENMGLYKNKPLTAYNNTGIELQTSIDRMIRQCTMKGEEHDALHLWLEPFMKKVDSLKKSTSLNEADKLFMDTGEQIKIFNQYFE